MFWAALSYAAIYPPIMVIRDRTRDFLSISITIGLVGLWRLKDQVQVVNDCGVVKSAIFISVMGHGFRVLKITLLLLLGSAHYL